MSLRRPLYVSATCESHRNVGPRGVHGCVTLEFEPASEFSFSSSANWPAGDNYDSIVEAAVRETMSEMRLTRMYACRLTSIKWHDVDSCAKGFALVSRFAVFAALGSLA